MAGLYPATQRARAGGRNRFMACRRWLLANPIALTAAPYDRLAKNSFRCLILLRYQKLKVLSRKPEICMITQSHLSALSRLFSSSVFREMAAKGKSRMFSRLLAELDSTKIFRKSRLVRDAFEAAYRVLQKSGFRDEYIYKTALTHKVLLGKHSLNTACMMSEFRVADCKADLVILNGTATVYEIKSERDSLNRLARQIEAYKRVFATAVVIVGEAHAAEVLELTSPDVGVLQLSDRYQISTLREAEVVPERISPVSVFESIRTGEAKQILTQLGIEVPNVPNTLLHAELRRRFERLDPKRVHLEMVRLLKRTRDLAPLSELVDGLPPSLHAAALTRQINRASEQRLIGAVNTRLREAVEWA